MTDSVFLSPKSIAIIGASDKEGSVGRAITSNIMKGYKGTIYPISPTRETVFDKKAYKSVLDVPGKIDLAVVVTKNTIVPAVLEELRGFLEEAAGVSKYKERRKETEFRLRDTKENLSRVQDLVQEIKQQSAKLKSQAEAANRYHKQQENLKFHQAQVWALKKRVVNQSWETIKKKIEEQTLELDQFTASLREIESKVETARQDYTKTADEINLFQSKFYDINHFNKIIVFW